MLPGCARLSKGEIHAVSVALVLVGKSITVHAAVEQLGLPRNTVLEVHQAWSGLAADSGWHAFRAAVVSQADVLAHRHGELPFGPVAG